MAKFIYLVLSLFLCMGCSQERNRMGDEEDSQEETTSGTTDDSKSFDLGGSK